MTNDIIPYIDHPVRTDVYLDIAYNGVSHLNHIPSNASYDIIATAPIMYSADALLDAVYNIGNVTMVDWDAFHEYVMPSVQGCPATMVNTAIRSACSEFCAKSFIWRQESALNDIYENVATYAFAPPKGAKVVTPYRVSINGREVLPTSLDRLEVEMPEWRESLQEEPFTYFLDNDDSIRLVGIPQKEMLGALTAGVVLKPSRDATECPNFLYEDWAEVIAAGALAKLLAMKGKIWAQEGLVKYYTDIFRAGISRAKSKSAKSYQRAAADMLPVNFYNHNTYTK